MNQKYVKMLIIYFYNNMEKVRAELAIFSLRKRARALHLTSFLLSVLL